MAIELNVTESGRKKPKYTLVSDLNGEVSLEDFLNFTKSSLIIIADQVLREEQANGFDKSPVTIVDGRQNKAVIDVNPLGSIRFVSRKSMSEIILETYNALLGRSKVLTGRYKSSNYVFLNGKQVATDLKSLETWIATSPDFQEKDMIRFVNIQPYARRLERLGVTAQRTQNRRTESRMNNKSARREASKKILSPNGTYFLTARAIRAKYKNNSVIRFTFLPGSSLGIPGTFKGGRKGKNSAGRPYLYPTILISVQEGGIK